VQVDSAKVKDDASKYRPFMVDFLLPESDRDHVRFFPDSGMIGKVGSWSHVKIFPLPTCFWIQAGSLFDIKNCPVKTVSRSVPDPCFWASRIRILLSSCKNSKKNLDSSYFVTLFEFLSLKNNVNVASKSQKQKKLCWKISFLLATWRSMDPEPGSGFGSGSATLLST